MKYKVESKCGRKKEIEAVNEQELNAQIVEEFDFEIEKVVADFPCTFIGLSQLDSRWADTYIGNTPYKIGPWGCLISSLCSHMKWYCDPKDPNWAAKNWKYTSNGSLYWNSITSSDCEIDFVWRYYRRDDNKVRSILSSEFNAAVVEVWLGSIKHWCAVVNYSPTKGFKIFDPYFDDYVYLNERYGTYIGFAEITKAK